MHDPYNVWYYDDTASDRSTNTYAITTGRNQPIELHPASPVQCNKIRIFARRAYMLWYYNISLKVDVYYGGAWHTIKNGYLNQGQNEIQIGSTQSVEALRVGYNAGQWG